jgi:hypothetical protein
MVAVFVRRVRDRGIPVVQVAKAMGISRQCAHQVDRHGRSWVLPGSTIDRRVHVEDADTNVVSSPEIEAMVLAARH